MGNGMTELLRATAVAAQVASIFAELMEKWVKSFGESKSLKNLTNFINNREGELYSRAFDRQFLPQIQNALYYNHPPIVNAVFEDKTSGKLIVIFKDKDAGTVDNIVNAITSRDKGIVPDGELGQTEGAIYQATLNNVPKNITEAISTYIQTKGVTNASIVKNDDGSYQIKFPLTEDFKQNNLDEIFSSAYFQTQGCGANIINYFSEERMQSIRDRVNTKEKINIVSPLNPNVFITVDETGFKIIKNNTPIRSVSRNQTSFDDELFGAIKSELTIPLVFTDDELKNLSNQEIYQLIPQSNASSNTPEQQKMAEIETNVRHLIHTKMSLDNDIASEVSLSFFDDTVSFDKFFHLEIINEINNEEAREFFLKAKKYYEELSPEQKEYFQNYYEGHYSFIDNMQSQIEISEIITQEENIGVHIQKAQDLAVIDSDALLDTIDIGKDDV